MPADVPCFNVRELQYPHQVHTVTEPPAHCARGGVWAHVLGCPGAAEARDCLCLSRFRRRGCQRPSNFHAEGGSQRDREGAAGAIPTQSQEHQAPSTKHRCADSMGGTEDSEGSRRGQPQPGKQAGTPPPQTRPCTRAPGACTPRLDQDTWKSEPGTQTWG